MQKIKFVALVEVDAGVALKRASSPGVHHVYHPCHLSGPSDLCAILFQSVVSDVNNQEKSIRCIGYQQAKSVLSDSYGESK